MKWLKDNWTLLVLIALGVFLLIFFMRGCQSNEAYKQRIRSQDEDIKIANAAIEMYKGDAEKSLKRAMEWERRAGKYEALIDELMAENAALEKQQEALEGKIEAMTPDKVVLETRDILGTKEVELEEIGVVFSLVAARKNLTMLESFSLCRQGVKKLAEAVEESRKEIGNLNNAISEYKTTVIEQQGALSAWENKERDWNRKFDLCQSQRQANWWKGLGTGAAIGAGAVLLLRLLLVK